MLKPLDSIGELIELIATVTQVTKSTVLTRLKAEVAEIGSNVAQAIDEQNIPLYRTSEALDNFYQHSDAFVYDSTVWNVCATKQKMRDFVQSRLLKHFTGNARVFCFGDGLGFDSAWLAKQGHQVKYAEPSVLCRAFAKQVFLQNSVSVEELTDTSEIQPASLDAVVCLDVLEHIPRPEWVIRTFRKWLKPDGLLFVHAPFWFIHWTRPTHLKENRRLSGNLSDLYHANGFRALDASVFWDPIVLQRDDRPIPLIQPAAAKLRVQFGKHLLRVGRWNSTAHNLIARSIARPPKPWAKSIQEHAVE